MAKRKKYTPKSSNLELLFGEVISVKSFSIGGSLKSEVLFNDYERGPFKCVYNSQINVEPSEQNVTLQGFFKPDGYFIIQTYIKNSCKYQ